MWLGLFLVWPAVEKICWILIVHIRDVVFFAKPFPGEIVIELGCIRSHLYAKKKPVLSYELFLKYGGEAGIRTPDTLPYTHFPGVLLQPLGHLTKFLLPDHMGATGRYYRELE